MSRKAILDKSINYPPAVDEEDIWFSRKMWLKVGTFSSYLWSEGLVSIIKQVSIKLIQYRKCPFFLAYLRDAVKVRNSAFDFALLTNGLYGLS